MDIKKTKILIFLAILVLVVGGTFWFGLATSSAFSDCSLAAQKAYKSTNSPAVYYITNQCAKRAFNKPDVFFSYFDSWNDVSTVKKSTLDSIADDGLGFMPWGSKYDPKYGALVKTVDDPKVYLLLGEEKYWIESESIFNALNYDWGWIEDVDSSLLDKYLIGSVIDYTDHHPNYSLVKYSGDPKVYRLEPDPNDSNKIIKKHISSETAFTSLGYRWDRIITVENTENYPYTITDVVTHITDDADITDATSGGDSIDTTDNTDTDSSDTADDSTDASDSSSNAGSFTGDSGDNSDTATTPDEICTGGLDEDHDGNVDCADLDCVGVGSCQATEISCGDGFDNDADGNIDCNDSNCSAHAACVVDNEVFDTVVATMNPQSSLSLGVPTTVSFGVPFPKGFISDSSLIRVKDSQGNEIPVYVRELLPWRDMSVGSDLSSIRSALIQFDYTFVNYNPVNITIEIGATRTSNVAKVKPVRDNWVLVNDEDYPASSGVYEPMVYVTLPADWLGDCVIKSKTVSYGSHTAFDWYDNGLTNNDPAVNNGQNFFKTMNNDVDSRVTEDNDIDYLNEGEYEPWLFDRAMAMYTVYIRSGNVETLKDSHRASYFYALHIDDNGYFDLKQISWAPYGDLKYTYGESMLTDLILTGDEGMLNKFDLIASAAGDYNYVLDPERTTGLWTERHSAFAWLAYITAYEATGNTTYASKSIEMADYFFGLQDSPPSNSSYGQAPNDGALMHQLWVHEGWWKEGQPYWVFSPWMSALFVDAMQRYYYHSGDSRVLESAQRFGDAVIDVAVEDQLMGSDGFKAMPWYIASSLGNMTDSGPWADREHCIDVAKITAFAYYAANLNGGSSQKYWNGTMELLDCAEWNQDNWIRSSGPEHGLTIYRLNPARKFNWWFRTTSDLDYLLYGDGS